MKNDYSFFLLSKVRQRIEHKRNIHTNWHHTDVPFCRAAEDWLFTCLSGGSTAGMNGSDNASLLSREGLRQRLQACSCQVLAALLLTLAAMITVVLSISNLPERRPPVETSHLPEPPAQGIRR
jgi:hypothetical protein